MVSPAGSDSDFVGRIVRVLRLDRSVFNEVEHDTSATGMAWTVVIIAALSTALGGFISELIGGPRFGSPVFGLINGLLSALIGFLIWSFTVYFVGTRIFGGTADYGEMQRTLGFAYAPNIFGILGGLPILGWIIGPAVAVWSIIAGYFAVKEGLDLDTAKSIFTIIISAIALIIVFFVVSAIVLAITVALGMGPSLVAPGAVPPIR